MQDFMQEFLYICKIVSDGTRRIQIEDQSKKSFDPKYTKRVSYLGRILSGTSLVTMKKSLRDQKVFLVLQLGEIACHVGWSQKIVSS